MSTYNLSTVFELIITKDQADNFVMQLDDLMNSIYDTKSNINKKLDSTLPPDKKEKIVICLQENKIDIDKPELIQKFITCLKESIKKLTTVEIQIAHELNAIEMNNLAHWLLINLKKKVLLKATINKRLIGGITIGYNGIYKDYSIKRKLEERIMKGNVLC